MAASGKPVALLALLANYDLADNEVNYFSEASLKLK